MHDEMLVVRMLDQVVRKLADCQNVATTLLTGAEVTKVVNACLSARNMLETVAKEKGWTPDTPIPTADPR